MAEGAGERDEVDILEMARGSDDFRRVVTTGQHMQIVVMTLEVGEEIGAETHEGHDQVLFFVDGEGAAVLDGERSTVGPGDLVFVHAGVHHNFINTGDVPLRLVTAYAPPEHEPGTVHASKADAEGSSHA
jgi:mannose-6-phosphate isomerase-like protein (cupin superfamily)